MHTYSEAELGFIQHKFKMDDSEMAVFMGACSRYNLNPLAMEIYPQIRTDRRSGERQMSIATGINGYRVLADRTGAYAGNDDPIFDDDARPQVATVTVYKVVGGVRCEFTATARWDQYFPGEAQGFMWKKMPHLMLGKVAEALALRKAFPAAIGGLYTDTEMEQAGKPINMIDDTAPVVPATRQEATPPQRPVAEEPKKTVKKKASKDATPEETPKAMFVRRMGDWTKLTGRELMDICKVVMTVFEAPIDGTAKMEDFIPCCLFVDKFIGTMSVQDALAVVTPVKSDESESDGAF